MKSMKRLVSLLTLSLFLFSQVASTEAAHSLSRSHLRTRAAAQSSADGGKGKAPMVGAIWEAL
ncbi:MAG: hypothetical protein HY590_02725, partial [Candidatus Omnitrophica bacterium]|nr:hypothetical protein [Candidatus Omnitrophota bacterium]